MGLPSHNVRLAKPNSAGVYVRHRPKTTLLYQIVREYWPEFQAEFAKHHLTLVWSAEYPPREGQRLAVKPAHGGTGTTQSLECIEKQVNARLYALIRVENDTIQRIVNQADRQSKLQLAASRLGDQATLQTGANDVQFSFRNAGVTRTKIRQRCQLR